MSTELEFGTGGLRGLLGEGKGRMNTQTITRVTQGLADYIIRKKGAERGVALAFDSRIMSEEFCEAAALCLNANGIRTYRFANLRPTPELSFAVRHLGCIAGIMITASHNPAEYNGYKVYWEDGAQITAPVDLEIMEAVRAVTDERKVLHISRREALEKGFYHVIGTEADEAYRLEIKRLVLETEAVRAFAGGLKIVYTPLHGAGAEPVMAVLNELGFTNLYLVTEQVEPDGRFPTVVSPNPEEEEAFTLALRLAKKVDADLVFGTDPDGDRLGVYVKGKETGEYHRLTGNMTGILLCDYILSRKAERGMLPAQGAVIKTIVTTDMVNALAGRYGVKVYEVLTGFKYIGELIRNWEADDSPVFLFGFEESYGCLTGTYTRDKDAVGAAALLCEAAAYYKQEEKTLWEQLENLYLEYGRYEERLETVTLATDDLGKVRREMEAMRMAPPKLLEGKPVVAIRDYLTGKRQDLQTGIETDINLPRSNVLYFELADGGWMCIRPSGTEPKIKYYYGYCRQ